MSPKEAGALQPWFETEPRPDATGRFLLVSYHYPPSTRIGALRWQEFTRLLAEAGWSFDVVMKRPDPEGGHCDEDLLDRLPPGVRLFSVPHPEHLLHILEERLHRLVRKPLSARNGGLPDESRRAREVDAVADEGETRPAIAREDVRWGLDRPRGWMRMYWSWLWRERQMVWSRKARRLAHRLSGAVEYDAVICSGPPHVSHLAAAAVAEAAGLPFVMDLRDPWSHAPHLPDWIASPVTTWLNRRDERRSVRAASLVVTNTETLEAAMAERYPEAEDRIVTVRNGFDAPARVPRPPTGNGRFSIRFAGTIYYARDPRPLFEGAARLVRQLELTPEQFGVDLIGNFDDAGTPDLQRLAADAGIREYVSIGSWRPREEAERFMAGAHVLVALPGRNGLGIPGKIYEYMRYPAWILALADEDSATDRLLAGTEAEVVPTKDTAAVAAALGRLYRRHLRTGRPDPLSNNPRFGRRAQAMELLRAIETLLGLESRAAPVARPVVDERVRAAR